MITRGRADQHRSRVTRPPDFDLFWDGVAAELDAIPLDPEMTPVPMRSTDEVEIFEIHYTSLDNVRIAGWYCRPRQSYIAAPYPGLSIVPGYVSEPTLPKSWAKMGYAAVGVAPRGKLRSNGQFNPGYPGLLINRIIDRNTYSYRGFYADAVRAIDFLLTRDEVIHDRIGVHGSSQGGALTIVTAALRPENIACGAAGAPYLTGFMDCADLTHSYPYEEMNEYFRLYPDRREQVGETLAYFDCVNLAEWVNAPMLIYAGLADDVCPPETAYALKDALPGEVTLHTWERCGHDAGSYWEMGNVEAFLDEHLRPVSTDVHAQTEDVPQTRVDDVDPQVSTTGSRDVGTPATNDGPASGADTWWDAIDAELATIPANPEFARQALQSSDFATVYRVRMTSLSNYPIAAWLSIPTGDGPYPAVISTPGYGSVVTPPHYDVRQRFVAMTIMSRGQRGADQPYAAAFPGHLTEGIASPDTYAFRGVMADMLRSYEVLTALPQVDPERVGIVGNDMALLLASRRPGARAVQVTATFWYRLAELAASTEAYPYEEINDYLRMFPHDRDGFEQTLAYLDLRYQTGRVTANVQINRDQSNASGDDAWLAGLVRGIDSEITYYDVTHEGQADHDANDAWLSEQLGAAAAPRLWRMQEIGPWP